MLVSPHQNFRVNQPAVIAEVIDNEAIVVNLDNGAYYSLRGSACTIWEMLAQQMAVPAVVQSLAQHYADSPEAIQSGVESLVADLLNEQLLVPADGAPDSTQQPALSTNGERPPFATPVLEKYTDMAELLLLDPIHDVDAAGWPHPAPDRQ